MKLRTPKRTSDRWALLESKTLAHDPQRGPMLTRHRLFRCPLFGVYVHEIHRPDADRDVHDHPWPFASLILSGGYEEIVTDVREATERAAAEAWQVRHWRRGSFHRMSLHRAHRITEVTGPLVTLLFIGRRQRDWGFYTWRGFVPWREYISAGGVNPGPDESEEDYL